MTTDPMYWDNEPVEDTWPPGPPLQIWLQRPLDPDAIDPVLNDDRDYWRTGTYSLTQVAPDDVCYTRDEAAQLAFEMILEDIAGEAHMPADYEGPLQAWVRQLYREKERATVRAAELTESLRWHPMSETPPRSGNYILGIPGHSGTPVALLGYSYGCWWKDGNQIIPSSHFTHWCPLLLPVPPAKEE